MNTPLLRRRSILGVLLPLVLVPRGTQSVLAGTTGRISGIVVDARQIVETIRWLEADAPLLMTTRPPTTGQLRQWTQHAYQ